ncbi:MAG: selenide, water dikinase SelD [Chloroflexota bacterium]|nr:MAG: selenide, water dikinase SelD [Chloroflexota bacterium]
MPPISDPRVIVGNNTNDDAAAFRLSDTQALVATVDYFTPIVDDPYDFGAIAAANALSDVYAMGGKPLFALAICGFPRDRLAEGVLERILRGGVDKAAEAGIAIVGGHTIDDAEPKYGLAVTGLIDSGHIYRNVGARVGDHLILTKPIGTGIIATAIKRGLADSAMIARATEVMATLNRAAADVMAQFEPSAVTDITGFGLLGHCAEMVAGSNLDARVYATRVPFLDGARALCEQDIVPDGTRRNLASLGDTVTWDRRLNEVDRLLLADAQTSGGLLIAVSGDRAEALRQALTAAGTLAAAPIGEVIPGSGGLEVVEA